MTDTMVTKDGQFVQAHVGPVHLERSAAGVDMSLIAAVTPNATLTRAQARSLSIALARASE